MYNPKDILTENGYEDYICHINNIKCGLECITNNIDDLHIGALSRKQDDDFRTMCGLFYELLPILKSGDGEKYET